jgi:hypothetical protein
MSAYRMQSHTRHKSAQVAAGYIREADKLPSQGSMVWGSESIGATMRAPTGWNEETPAGLTLVVAHC